jgi:tRNA threonylcarbamoyladenosine biosynthesis protein TsaE
MRRTLEVVTTSEIQTVLLGRAIGGILKPKDAVLMTGNLGAGKTILAKGMVSQAVGVSEDDVVSPTFTLINTFEGAFPVHHADLYRIEGAGFDDIGLEEAIDEGGALIVEWAEKIGRWEPDSLRILIRHVGKSDSRIIVLEWEGKGVWSERLDQIIRSGGLPLSENCTC